MSMSLSLQAQESATVAQTNEEDTSSIVTPYDPEKTAKELAEKEEVSETVIEEKEEPMIESNAVATPSYQEMIAVFLKQNKISGYEEVLWQLLDSDYKKIKNNDFEYQKVKDLKYKEMQEIVKKSDEKRFALNSFITVGNYDFKAETYPITAVMHTVEGMMTSYNLDLIKSTLMFANLYDSKGLEDKGYLTTFDYKIKGLEKLKSFKLKKELAEKLSANLSMNRSVYCVMDVSTPIFKTIKDKYLKKIRIDAESSFKKMTCYMDSSRTALLTEF